ncbi:MAG: DUF1571 domain-containing protein [Planctomycetaceae bacterium]
MSKQNRNNLISRRHVLGAIAGATFSAGLVQAADAAAEHPLTKPVELAKECLSRAKAMSAYEATFTKREIVGKSLIAQQMRMKVRHEPFSVYMYFENPSEGREVIYVEGRNNNNLLVHETGLAGLIGTLELSPTGSQVMAENRYPITKAGIANMVEAVVNQWEEEKKYGETEVKYFKDAKVAEFTCRVIEGSHPQPRRQFPFHVTRLWIDEESGLAVRVQQLGFPTSPGSKPPIIEDYIFSRIKPDVRLTDRDFDTRNPSYRF